MAKATKNLYDVVFLSHTCGLNLERIELTDKQADNLKKAVKIAFDEDYTPSMGDDAFVKPVEETQLLQVIRSSAGVVEVLCTYVVPCDSDSTIRKELVAKAEKTFKGALSNLDDDDLEEAVENGFAEDSDGDCVNLVWSDIT